MKLSDYRDSYYFYSGKASDVARQLAFAGIVVVWIFKVGGDDRPHIPQTFFLPIALFCITLGFDLMQYISGTLVWGWFSRHNERKYQDATEEPDLKAPSWFNWPGIAFFTLKLVAISLGYVFLIKAILRLEFFVTGQ